MKKKPIRGLVLDLDDALYYSSLEWQAGWSRAWAHAALKHGVKMSFDEAHALALEIFQRRGHIQQVLADRFGLDGWAVHEEAGKYMDHTQIEVCAQTQASFERYRDLLPMVILTHGMPNWADRMLRHIGLDQIFPPDLRVTLRDTNGLLKSQHEEPFYEAAKRLDIPVDELAIEDDATRNLIIPHRLGMTTVQITHDHPQQAQPAHVDFRIEKAYHIFELIEQGLIPWHTISGPAPLSSPFMAL